MGDPAPDFAVVDWQGAPRTAADFRGAVVVIDFWATWCTVCRAALPALDGVARRHAADGLQVLAVNIDAQRSAADAFLAQRLATPTLTLLHDPNGAAMARCGAEGMPALYVIDRAGTVRVVETGYTADAVPAIEAKIVELLGRPVTSAAASGHRD